MSPAARIFDPRRAVEILEPRYGSGYRIGGRLVLTSAHLVSPAVGAPCRIRERPDDGAHVIEGTVAWLPAGWEAPDSPADKDLALVTLSEDADECDPAVLGRLPMKSAVLRMPFELFGWPGWAQTHRGERTLAGGRHIDGVVYLADTSGEGLLPLEPRRRGADWGGLSGAAVVCGGVVVAVQRQQQNPDREASLEAVSLERFAEDDELRALLISAGIDVSWPTARVSSGLADRLRPGPESPETLRQVDTTVELRREEASPMSPGWARGAESQPERVFGVKLYPIDHFAGRSAAFAELSLRLAGLTPPKVLVIAGTAGVGKTQLAVEYAFEEREALRVVWWVRASRPETLLSDFAALAGEGPLREGSGVRPGQSAEEQVARVRSWLERNDGWLLVFDNAHELQALRDVLPTGGDGRVIVTSRGDTGWEPIGHVMPLDVLDPTSASEMLRLRSGEDDAASAAELARELGYLPLALEQAAGFVSQTAGFGLKAYLKRFQRQSKDLLDRGQPFGYEGTINTTWSLLLEQLQEKAPEAVDLLTLFAFLDPDDIPTTFVFEHLEAFDEDSDEEPIDAVVLADCVRELRAYGLVRASGDSLFVHRLLQTVIRNGLDSSDEQDWAGSALGLVVAVFSGHVEAVGATADLQGMLPHALAAIGHAERLDADPELRSVALNNVGLYLRDRGRYAEAVDLLRRSLDLDVRLLGSDDPALVLAHSNLGLALEFVGQHSAARTELERALELSASGETEDSLLAIVYNNLGMALQALAELGPAREAFKRALEISERSGGGDNAFLASLHNNLGTVMQGFGALDEARAEFEKALALGERAFDLGHESLVNIHNNLGTTLLALGDMRPACNALERAIESGELTLGADHPTLVSCHTNLSYALRALGDVAAARRHAERALEIGERAALPPEHSFLISARAAYGEVLQAQGDPAAARAEFATAIELGDPALGNDHPILTNIRASFGMVLNQLEERPRARLELSRAVEVTKRRLGADHHMLVHMHSSLGVVLRDMGELEPARAELDRAITLGHKIFDDHHPVLINVHTNRATVLQALKDLEGARDDLEHALEIGEDTLGAGHPRLVNVHVSLGELLRELGELAAAYDHFASALRIADEATPADSAALKRSLRWVGVAERELGEFDDAREHLKRELAIRQADDGKESLHVGYALVELGRAERLAGNLDVAREHFCRALALEGRALDADDVQIGYLLGELGAVERALAETHAAKEHLERAVSILGERLGVDSTSVAEPLHALGTVSAALGDLVTAKASLEWALGVSRALPGETTQADTVVEDLRQVLERLGPLPAPAAPESPSPDDQQRWVFDLRRRAYDGEELRPILEPLIANTISRVVAHHETASGDGVQDTEGLRSRLEALLPEGAELPEVGEAVGRDVEALVDEVALGVRETWDAREADLGVELTRVLERYLVMNVVDSMWTANRWPELAGDLAWRILEDFLRLLANVEVETEEPTPGDADP